LADEDEEADGDEEETDDEFGIHEEAGPGGSC
jgi:hypothetical protein